MSAYELIPFRLLLDRVIPKARPHFRTILPTIGLPLIIATTLFALGQNRWMESLAALGSETGPAALGPEFFRDFSIVIVLFFVFMIFYMLAYTALAVASMDAVAGRAVSMRRAWGVAVQGKTLWTLFLLMAVTFLSVMMCFIPALIAWPLVSLTLPVMIEEQRFGLDAIKRSSKLIWWNGTGRTADSNFLQVCVMLFVGWLIQNAASGLVQVPLMISQQYWVFREATGGGSDLDAASLMAPLWLQLPTQVLAALVVAITWFYWTFGFSMLYVEFKRRRKAPDLQRAIDELTAAHPAPMTETHGLR